MSAVLDWLGGLPSLLVYLVLGLGAALENLVPPIPADTFVVVGGLMAARGSVDALSVWAVTWAFNVAAALVVYATGYRYGRTFFEEGAGRFLLTPDQLDRIRRFYRRFGVWAVFLARFLPGLRAVVPAFAGVSHKPFWGVALPVALASGVWYGALVAMGVVAGRNLERVETWLSNTNRSLLAVAVVVAAAIGWWWWRSRRKD